jgi:tetratricopeptide (TPR) repeat protein
MLDVFVLATTAPNDETIQQVARDLMAKHRKHRLFEVRVEGWTTLRQRVTDYPSIVAKYFADFAPVDVVVSIDAAAAVTRDERAETRAMIQQTHATVIAVLERNDPADRLQTRIADTAKLIEDGLLSAGLKAPERLWLEESVKASPRNRYRIRANIGFAHLKLGDRARAIAELRAAAAEDPAWPKARAVLATAELLDGNRETAFEIAQATLGQDSSVQQAVTVMVEAEPESMTVAALRARIPPVHLERRDILLALVQHARRVSDGAAREELISRAVALYPQDWRVLAAQAEKLLEPIFAQAGVALTHAVPATRVPDLEHAIALLQRAWEQLVARDDARIGAHVAANLLAALDIAGRKAEYEELLPRALNIAPTFQPLLRSYAQSMIAVDDWAAAAKALDAMAQDKAEFPDRLLKVQASIHLGKPREAIAEARALELETDMGRKAEMAAALQIEAAFTAGCLDEILPELLERWPSSILVRSVAHNHLPAADSRRATLLHDIKRLSRAINDPGDRMHAAEALYTARQFSAAAEMYEGLYAPDKDTLALFRKLKALYFAERRREARLLFDRLSPGLKAMPRYADLGVAIYEHAGLLRDARAIIERALAADDTLRRRVHWLSLSERLGDTTAILGWLDTIRPEQSGAPQDLMTVALMIDRLQGDPRCFALAYRALRLGYADPELHLAYMVGLVFTGQAYRRVFSQPTEVATDTAVLLEEKGGSRKLVRILETEPDPKLERGEIAPDAELSPALTGRKVGDEIEVPTLGVEPTIYVIREIRHKYLHAHYRSLEQFETLFPGHRAFGSFHIDESKGDEKFRPILDSLKRRGEFAMQLTGMYRKGQLPLVLMSKYSGVSPCDTWDYIVGQPDLGFRVCIGHPQEFATAQEVLAKNGKAVADAATLYSLTRLGIAEKVRACFEDLGVVQTTIDSLRQLLHERTQELGKKHGMLGWDGEHYRAIEVDESFDAERTGQAQAALSFAESLTLVAAEPSAAMPMEARELFEDIDVSFLDTIWAAQGSDRLLYCDDLTFRQLVSESSGVAGVWTQPVAVHAVQLGRITGDDYYEIIGAVAAADYRFTSIDNCLVLHQLRRTDWAITPAIETLAPQIALPTNEITSVGRVIADLAQFGWPRKPSSAAYVRLFAIIFKAIRRLQPSGNLHALLNMVLTIIRGRFRSNGYQVFLKNQLLNSTQHTSAASLVANIAAVADRTLEPIAEALNQALAGAQRPGDSERSH